MSNAFLIDNSLMKSITKITVSFPKLSQNSILLSAGVLECISVNPLKWLIPSWKAICSKLSLPRVYHLLKNFVKCELLHKQFLRILRLFKEASTYNTWHYTFSFFVSIVTSKMELFGNVFNSFYFLIIATKNSILDVAGVLDPTLTTDIFSLHSWI